MNLSHAYSVPPPFELAERLLLRALDLGLTHFDTAALYGFGHNEELIGRVLKPHRGQITLASKCGITGIDGRRMIDGRPESLLRDCENSLRRLRTEVIDLYYLHRWDRAVSIEDSMGALARLVEAGKVRAIGLSEVSAATLRRAHAVHPVAVVQSEYSLWTRNPEVAVLEACAELGTAFVAFSPLARGFLSDTDIDPQAFLDNDIRRHMPRFQAPQWQRNLRLLPSFRALARQAGCSPAQLALAWVLAQGEHLHVIPGTTSLDHLGDNFSVTELQLPEDFLAQAAQLISPATVSGPRYNDATQAEIDTEELAETTA